MLYFKNNNNNNLTYMRHACIIKTHTCAFNHFKTNLTLLRN